jgi:hypothetical protein
MRPKTRHDQAVDRARVGVALHDDLVAEMLESQARHMIGLRGAVGEEPGAARAPGFGGEQLGLLPRGWLGPGVDALDQRGDVERQRPVAQRLAKLRVRARPALMTRNVEAPRLAGGVCAQRV